MGQEWLVCLSVDVRGWSKLKRRCQWDFVEVSSPTSRELFNDSDLNWIQQTQMIYPQIYSISRSSLCNILVSIFNIFVCSPKNGKGKDARLPWPSQGVTHCRDVDANGRGLGQGGKAGALGLPRSSKRGMSSTLPTYCARVFLVGCFKHACFCFHHGSPTNPLSEQVINLVDSYTLEINIDKLKWHEITKYVLVDLWMSYSKRCQNLSTFKAAPFQVRTSLRDDVRQVVEEQMASMRWNCSEIWHNWYLRIFIP